MALLGLLEFYSARNALAAVALLVLLLVWLWPRRLLAPQKGFRWMGRMEKVVHSIARTCGHMNVAVALQLEGAVEMEALQLAVQVVQGRHALLRSTVADVEGAPAIFEGSVAASAAVPLAVAHASVPDEWEAVLTRELNTPFAVRAPPFRCTLLRSADHASSDMLLTAHHGLLDGKALLQLADELLSAYLDLVHARDASEAREDALVRAMAATPAVTARMRALLVPPEPLPPPVDVLYPGLLAHKASTPGLRLFCKHLWFLVKKHALRFPDSLKNTAAPRVPSADGPASASASPACASRWETGVASFELPEAATRALMRRCGEQQTAVESLVFVAVVMALAQFMDQSGLLRHPEQDFIRLWGLMQVDLRPSCATQGISACSLGVFASFLDFVVHVRRSTDLDDDGRAWHFASRVASDLRRSLANGRHLCSLVFTEKISSFFSIYSKYVATPQPCPAFVLAPIGGDALSRYADTPLRLKGIRVATSSATSYPMPLVTSHIFADRLHCTFSYSTNTTSAATAGAVTELMRVRLLELAAAADGSSSEEEEVEN